MYEGISRYNLSSNFLNAFIVIFIFERHHLTIVQEYSCTISKSEEQGGINSLDKIKKS